MIANPDIVSLEKLIGVHFWLLTFYMTLSWMAYRQYPKWFKTSTAAVNRYVFTTMWSFRGLWTCIFLLVSALTVLGALLATFDSSAKDSIDAIWTIALAGQLRILMTIVVFFMFCTPQVDIPPKEPKLVPVTA